MRKLLLLLLIAIPVYGQGVRFESNVVQSATVAGVPNVLTSVSTAAINICTFPASGVPCVNKAATYTSSTITTPCSTAQQLVLPGTNNCVSTTDAQGNWGIWVAAGTYSYTVTIAGVNLGPYTFSVGGAGGGSSISLQTNGVTNPVQNVLNLKQGAGVSTTADGAGGVTITNTAPPAPLLQTNSVNNGSQSKLNLVAGSNVGLSDDTLGNITVSATGGGGGGSPTVGAAGVLQKGDGAGNHVASNATEVSNYLTIDDSVDTKGPNPNVAVTRFGARSFPINDGAPASPGVTATCTASNPSVPISGSGFTFFKNGNGIDLQQCGDAPTMSTPSAPTVTPAVAIAPVQSGYVATNSSAGAVTNRCYVIAAADVKEGVTAASPEVCVSGGSTILGSDPISMTSCARVGQTVTCLTSAHTLPIGCTAGACGSVQIIGTSDDANFGGSFPLSAVADTTHIAFITGLSIANGATSASTGGTMTYFNSDHLVLPAFTAGMRQYAIYEGASGAETLVGFSRLNVAAITTLPKFYDWDYLGTTYSGAAGHPYFWPTTPPVSALNQTIATTIVSGAGSSPVVVANAPTTTPGAGSPVLLDDCPGIQAAFNFANNTNGGGGMVSIPPEISGAVNNPVYIINSYCKLTGAITQSMPINLQETLEFNGQWYGDINVNSLYISIPQFGIEGHVPIDTGKANPGIYFTGGSMRGVNIEAQGNSNMAMFHVNAGTSYFQDMNFRSNSSTGYNTTLFEDFAPGVGFGWKFTNVSFTGNDSGTPGSTFTPWLLTKGNTEISFDYIPMSKRGLYFQSTTFGMGLTFIQRQETQSLAMPWLSFYYGEGGNAPGHVNLTTVATDTAQPPYITNFASGTSTIGFNFTINGAGAPSSGGAFMTGAPFAAINIIGVGFSDTFLGQNMNVHYVGDQEQAVLQHDSIIGPSYGIYSMTAIPPAPTCSTAVAGPPYTDAFSASTFSYAGVYPNGHIGQFSAPSATTCASTLNTNQVSVVIPGALTGAVSYVFWRNFGGSSVQYGVLGSGCVNSTTLTTIIGPLCGTGRPDYIKGGPSGISPSLVWAPAMTIDGPNGVGPHTINADSTGSLKVGTRWIASLDPTAGDICAKINHIALTLMPSTGGVIDADGLGSQACATNPWAGVGSIGIKFTSVGTQFLVSTQWLLPPSFAWDCGVQGSATRGCSIVAQAGFPTSTAVLEYGTALIAQSIHVSGLTVDCGNIAGSIGIEDQFAQEGAYANDVTINKCASIGLNLIGTGGGAQNSGAWERINVQTGTSAGANTLCIAMNQVPSAIDVKRWTCNMTTNSGTAPNYGVQIDGGGFLDEGQAQSMAVAGVAIGLNAASTSSTKIAGLKTNGSGGSVPTGVLISSAHNVQHVMLFGIQGAITNNVVDQQTTCSSGTSTLGFYDLGSNDSSGNYTRLGGNNQAGCGIHVGYLGIYTVGLQEATNQYSANHTITTTEGNVIATATSTMTLPHASVGNIWNVFCKAGTCTLTSDGGTLYVNGTTGAYVIPVSQGVTAYCDGTNCYAQAGGGGGGGGGGTILGSLQYAVGYYSAAGTASTINGTNVGLTGQILTSVNASAPTFSSPSLIDSASSPVTSASYPIACDSGTAMVDRARTVLFQSGASVPTLPDSTGTGCAGMVVKLIDDGAGALVVGRTGSDTFIVINGTSSPAPATSFTLQNGDFATASQNASASWEVTITQNQNLGTPTTLTLTNALGLLCGGLPALSGDTSSPAGTCTTTTTKINGVTMPASADVLGSNSSPGPVAATPHGVSHLLFCIDSSGSGTTQVCNTTPTFSPGAGDMLIYKTGTTNTGSTTINVNSAGAATVKKWQGTADLVAGDLLLNTYNFLIFDGTNWEIQSIGNAPGGTTALSAIVAATGGNTISSGNNGAQLWRWSLTSNQIAWALGEAVAATGGTLGNQYLGQFITSATSTAVPLNVTSTVSGSLTLPTLHITPTWNTSGVVDAGILLNVTNTASGAASLLADFQVGGTSKWKVDKSGNETAAGTITCSAATCLGSDTATTQAAADNSTKVATTAYVDAHFIANGTSTMGTGGISSGTCATVVTTTATGTATTDVIIYTPNTDPTVVTGYAPSASGSLYIWAYPSSGNVNFKVCNPNSGTITPSALTLNWKVVR